jgi:D-sedoheptulose 7-phosphate isomerase
VHPVIVGKRALPALALTAEGGLIDTQLALLADEQDIVIAFGAERGSSTRRALEVARARGALTISCGGGSADWGFCLPGEDASIDQELTETLYHVLWELVHVFFEHRGLLDGRTERRVQDTGASSFLYPFLGEQEHDLEAVVADVRASVLAKAQEASQLRAQTLTDGRSELAAGAVALRDCFDAGGRLLALGNGGSATDAMDAVADFRSAGRPAIDLTEDPAILTAIANDIGTDAIFSRQVIAYGAAGDALLDLSTQGNSTNLIATHAEARRGGRVTSTLTHNDGGRIHEEQLADHVILTRSEHIPRIQEAQASAYHVLCELVEAAGAANA